MSVDFNVFSNELINNTITSFQRKEWAKEQRSKHKVPFDELFNEFKENGYLLLTVSDERIRIAYYLCYNHPERGVQRTRVSNIRHRKSACIHCRSDKVANTKRLSNNKVNKIIENKSLKWIDGEYQNNSSVLTYQCVKHENQIFEKQFYLINKAENNCPKCLFEYNQSKNEKNKIPIEQVKEAFEKVGLILLEDNYINNTTKMKCYCKNHKGIIYKSYSTAQQGSGCRQCSREIAAIKKRKDYDKVYQEFDEKGFILLDTDYKNGSIPLRCKCKKHLDSPDLHISRDNLIRDKHGCKYCWNEKRRGETSPNWKGGTSLLIDYLRNNHIAQWKKDSMEKSNYKCVISGKRFDDIHHLYSMSKIVNETLIELNLDSKPISDYSQEELDKIIKTCLSLHFKYPLGVCLTREIHELFHKTYGYKENTPEQFEEFKENYKLGHYDHLLIMEGVF